MALSFDEFKKSNTLDFAAFRDAEQTKEPLPPFDVSVMPDPATTMKSSTPQVVAPEFSFPGNLLVGKMPVRAPFTLPQENVNLEARGILSAAATALTRDVMEAIPRAIVLISKEFKKPGQAVEEPLPPVLANMYGDETYKNINAEIKDSLAKGNGILASYLGPLSQKTLDIAFPAGLVASAFRALARTFAKGGERAVIEAFKTLGSPKNEAEYAANYRQLARQFHPDLTGGDSTAITQINKAKQILDLKGLPASSKVANQDLVNTLEMLGRETRLGRSDLLKLDVARRTTPTGEPLGFKELPGQRVEPGQPQPVGLSIQRMEPVGYGGERPKVNLPTVETPKSIEPVKPTPSTIIQAAHNDYARAQEEVLTQLELSEPGQRLFTDYGKDKTVTAVPSTFPRFVPEELRSKELFDTVAQKISAGEPLTGARQKRLADVIEQEIFNRMDPQLADEKAAQKFVTELADRAEAETNVFLKGIQKDIVDKLKNKTFSIKQFIKGREEAFKQGEKQGKIDARKEIYDRIALKEASTQEVKDLIVAYADSQLSGAQRGALLKTVRDAKTQTDLAKAFVRIDSIVEAGKLKKAISDLKSSVQSFVTSPSISADYRTMIEKVMSDYELTGHTKATIEELKATQEYLNRMRVVGEPTDIPQRLLDKLQILGRIPKDELSLELVQSLQAEIDFLAKLGETKLRTNEALYESEKAARMQQLIDTATPIETKEKIKPKGIGEKLTVAQNWVNRFYSLRNYAQRTFWGLKPIDVFAELTGMQPMKRALDIDHSLYLTANDIRTKALSDLIEKNNLDTTNFERVGVYAISKQKGGIERLVQNNGLIEEEIRAVELSKEERELYDFVRKEFDDVYPALRKWALREFNIDLPKISDYVSFIRSSESFDEIPIQHRFGGNNGTSLFQTKNVRKGFTEQRKEMSNLPLEKDIVRVFARHMDDAAYALNMGRDLRMFFEIVNSPKMLEKLGDFGQEAWLEYINLMARKGGVDAGQRIKTLDYFRRNLSVGVLAFRLSSIMVQLTSFADTMGTLGSRWALSGARAISTSKEWRNFVLDNFHEIRKSIGDDPAFRDLPPNVLGKLGEAGMAPLKYLDGLMRMTAASGAYQKLARARGIPIDLKNPDKELIADATELVRASQGSSFIKDQPLALTTGLGTTDNVSLNKMIYQFQSFLIHRFENIKRQVFRERFGKGNYASAAMSLFWFTLFAWAMEEAIRRGTGAVVNLAASATGGEQKERDPFITEMSRNAFQSIPLAGQLMSSISYGSSPVPAINTIGQAVEGVTSAVRGKKPVTKAKGAIRAFGAGAGLLGVPGASQFSQYTSQAISPEKPSSSSDEWGSTLDQWGDNSTDKWGSSSDEKWGGPVSSLNTEDPGYSMISDLLAVLTGAEIAEASTRIGLKKPKNMLGIPPEELSSVQYPVEKEMPTVTVNGEQVPIDKIKIGQPEKPSDIKRIIITKPNGKKEIITNRDLLSVANRIKDISDQINPKWTNYLIKVAYYESTLGQATVNTGNKDKTVDNGVFQINDKSFPIVSPEQAHNLDFATLFAIGLIDSGRQNKWVSNQKAKLSTILLES